MWDPFKEGNSMSAAIMKITNNHHAAALAAFNVLLGRAGLVIGLWCIVRPLVQSNGGKNGGGWPAGPDLSAGAGDRPLGGEGS